MTTNTATSSRLWQPSDPKHVLIISRWLPAGVDVVGALEQRTNCGFISEMFSASGERNEAINARKEFHLNAVARTRTYLFPGILAVPDTSCAGLMLLQSNASHGHVTHLLSVLEPKFPLSAREENRFCLPVISSFLISFNGANSSEQLICPPMTASRAALPFPTASSQKADPSLMPALCSLWRCGLPGELAF